MAHLLVQEIRSPSQGLTAGKRKRKQKLGTLLKLPASLSELYH